MWPHLWRFSWHVWTQVLSWHSATTFSIVRETILVPLSVFCVTLRFKLGAGWWRWSVLAGGGMDVLKSFGITVMVLFAILGAAYVAAIPVVVYEDHVGLISDNGTLRSDNGRLKVAIEELKSKVDSLQRRIDGDGTSTHGADEIARRVAMLTGHNLTLKKRLLGMIEAIRQFEQSRNRGTPPFDIKIDKNKDPVAWNTEWNKYDAAMKAYTRETHTVYLAKIAPSLVKILREIAGEQAVDTHRLQNLALSSEPIEFYGLCNQLELLLDKL